MSRGFPAFFRQFWLHLRKDFRKNLAKHRIRGFMRQGQCFVLDCGVRLKCCVVLTLTSLDLPILWSQLHIYSHTHTHTRTHAHTHTHTHTHTLSLTHTHTLKKTPFSMFFKPFGLRGHRQCPHKPPSCCNTHIIIQLCVLINHIYQFTHTDTQVWKIVSYAESSGLVKSCMAVIRCVFPPSLWSEIYNIN